MFLFHMLVAIYNDKTLHHEITLLRTVNKFCQRFHLFAFLRDSAKLMSMESFSRLPVAAEFDVALVYHDLSA